MCSSLGGRGSEEFWVDAEMELCGVQPQQSRLLIWDLWRIVLKPSADFHAGAT